MISKQFMCFITGYFLFLFIFFFFKFMFGSNIDITYGILVCSFSLFLSILNIVALNLLITDFSSICVWISVEHTIRNRIAGLYWFLSLNVQPQVSEIWRFSTFPVTPGIIISNSGKCVVLFHYIFHLYPN